MSVRTTISAVAVVAGLGIAIGCGNTANRIAMVGRFPAAPSVSTAPAQGKMTAEQRVEAWKAGLAPELRAKVTQERKGAFLYAHYTVEPEPDTTLDACEVGILATDEGVLQVANEDPQEVACDIDGDGKDDLLTTTRTQGVITVAHVVVSGPTGPRPVSVAYPEGSFGMLSVEWVEHEGKPTVEVAYSTSMMGDDTDTVVFRWDSGSLVAVRAPESLVSSNGLLNARVLETQVKELNESGDATAGLAVVKALGFGGKEVNESVFGSVAEASLQKANMDADPADEILVRIDLKESDKEIQWGTYSYFLAWLDSTPQGWRVVGRELTTGMKTCCGVVADSELFVTVEPVHAAGLSDTLVSHAEPMQSMGSSRVSEPLTVYTIERGRLEQIAVRAADRGEGESVSAKQGAAPRDLVLTNQFGRTTRTLRFNSGAFKYQ